MGQFAVVARLALAHWKESLIVLLATAATVFYVQWRGSLINEGIAQERARVADSTLAATAKPIARVDTLLVRDTVKVRLTIARLDTLRDTLLLHLTDTVRVKEFVRAADSTAKACSELAGDCAEFRRLATIRFAAYEAKIAAQPIAQPKSCTVSNVVFAGLGVVGGFVAGRR